jgi:hypothetical protein
MWEVGDIVDGTYLIKEEKGSGCHGEVMLVSDLDSNVDLAVKRPNDTKDYIIDLFKDEIIQWIRLTKHPHITTCFYY